MENQENMAIKFAQWLNQNYCTWNPDDDTWIHRITDHGFTTTELFEKFIEECQKES